MAHEVHGLPGGGSRDAVGGRGETSTPVAPIFRGHLAQGGCALGEGSGLGACVGSMLADPRRLRGLLGLRRDARTLLDADGLGQALVLAATRAAAMEDRDVDPVDGAVVDEAEGVVVLAVELDQVVLGRRPVAGGGRRLPEEGLLLLAVDVDGGLCMACGESESPKG